MLLPVTRYEPAMFTDRAPALAELAERIADIADGGRPDGLTVDAEGGVWTAVVNAGTVHRYSATGRLEEVLDLPAQKVTACTFGGERLDELYVTTSAENLAPGSDPYAGCLFCARPGVVGLPVLEFAG